MSKGKPSASKAPVVGVDWPVAAEGSTTKAAKKLWGTVATAGGDAELAQEVDREKNWRYGYVPHMKKVAELMGSVDAEKCLSMCKAGLDECYSSFVIRAEDGSTMTLKEAAAKPAAAEADLLWTTKVVKGEKTEVAPITMEYQGKTLSADEIATQTQKWADEQVTELDVADKVKQVLPMCKEGLLKDKYFVLLGAGSEMGPFRFLLEQGAHVVAVRTKKQDAWKEMEAFAKTTSGTLYMPELRAAPGTFGCDILGNPVAVRDWVLSCLQDAKDVTVGMYTYLDGEAHVRVSLGCDVIQQGVVDQLGASKTVRLAWIGSPSVSTPISKEMLDSIPANRASCPWWMKVSMAKSPAVSELANGVCLFHGLSENQGPNYCLAKTVQVWRFCLTEHVSFVNGPFTKTASVCSNKTMATMLQALHNNKPCEAFEPNVAATMCALLLAYHVLVGSEKAQCAHPWEAMKFASMHGGTLRMGFDLESSKVLGASMLVAGKLA